MKETPDGLADDPVRSYRAACTRCDLRATIMAQSCGKAETRYAAAGWRDVVVPSRERGGIGLCPLCAGGGQ